MLKHSTGTNTVSMPDIFTRLHQHLELIEMPARRATIESPYSVWHRQRGAASLALMKPADGHADGVRFTLWLRRCPPKGIPHELITFGVGRAVP